MEARVSATDKDKGREAGGVLKDLTSLHNRAPGRAVMIVKEKQDPSPLPKRKEKKSETNVNGKAQDSVQKRVNEWQRERERLREMERLEIFGKERDGELQQVKEDEEEQCDMSFATTSYASDLETELGIQVATVAVRAAAQVVPASPQSSGM
jgi:hypothetical protein